MDHLQFDDLTRSVVGDDGTRRALLRLLAGGVLGGLAARLRLAEVAAAKRKRRADHPPHAAPQTEGKRRKSDSKKHQKKHRKKPTGVNDIALCRLDCEATGGKCCPDGSCVLYGLCCPGERMCTDGFCQPVRQCCDDEWPCPDGSCVLIGDCCPGMKRCGVSSCIPENQCCPGDDSAGCQPCEEEVCVNGQWICQAITDDCPGGEWNPERCRCEYCEEICNGTTHMCQSIGCSDGSHCEDGMCIQMCTAPRSQLCCKTNAPNGTYCSCRFPNETCYACSSGICACVPGQTCCNPNDGSLCPRECNVAPCV